MSKVVNNYEYYTDGGFVVPRENRLTQWRCLAHETRINAH